jgi:hypothetical protein
MLYDPPVHPICDCSVAGFLPARGMEKIIDHVVYQIINPVRIDRMFDSILPINKLDTANHENVAYTNDCSRGPLCGLPGLPCSLGG